MGTTGHRRGRLRLDMTVSLDGYVAGPDDGVGAPMGAGGFRLFNWLDHRDGPGPSGEAYAEAIATRALLAGRRTSEHAGYWGGDHHDGVPILVLTHHVPAEAPPGDVRFVTDPVRAATEARAAADGGDVLVHGAGAGQALLRAGEIDEIVLHVVPVLLGRGRRLFDGLADEHVELDLVGRTATTPADAGPEQQVLHLRYAVRRAPAART